MLCVTRSIWNRWWQQVATWGVVEVASQRVHQVEEEEEVLEQEQVVESQLCGHLCHHPPPDQVVGQELCQVKEQEILEL